VEVIHQQWKWSVAKLAYTALQRSDIMKCIQRLNGRESAALQRVDLKHVQVRKQIRAWFYDRWSYLLEEYEKVLPHVDELP
jgi:hypothetical protein